MKIILSIALLIPSFSGLFANQPKPAPAYNVVIIAVDGLRADHVGSYGYKRDTTPRLDARAKTAVIFERAIAQGSWTLPSFASLFTSRYPESHQAVTFHRTLSPTDISLTQVLHDAGLRTAGFAGGHFLDPIFGFARGFDVYRASGWGIYRYFQQTAPQAVKWLQDNKDKRFFIFVHGNDLHPPFDLANEGEHVNHHFDSLYKGAVDSIFPDYFFVAAYNNPPSMLQRDLGFIPSPGYLKRVEDIRSNPQDIEHLVAHYDDQILAADAQIEKIFDALKTTGHDKDTIVILTADHGMEWNEKGKLATAFHATSYDTVIRVPLVIWHPELKPSRIKDPVELVDLAPTILDWLGLPSPSAFQGKSFAALAKEPGRTPQEKRYAFSSSSKYDDSGDDLYILSIQDRRWKLIFFKNQNKLFLYDIEKDPGETTDLRTQQPTVTAQLTKKLSEHAGYSITPKP